MEITYGIYHIDGRVMRNDGRLVDLSVTEIKLIPTFPTREEAASFLAKTNLIPQKFKSYFRVHRVGWRSL